MALEVVSGASQGCIHVTNPATVYTDTINRIRVATTVTADDVLLLGIITEDVGGTFSAPVVDMDIGGAFDMAVNGPLTLGVDIGNRRVWLWQHLLTGAEAADIENSSTGSVSFSTQTGWSNGVIFAEIVRGGTAILAVASEGGASSTAAAAVDPPAGGELVFAAGHSTPYSRGAWTGSLDIIELAMVDGGVNRGLGTWLSPHPSNVPELTWTAGGVPTSAGAYYWLFGAAVGEAHQLPERPFVGVRPLPYEVKDDMLNVDERQVLGILHG